MTTKHTARNIIVFDIGGTWFRSGIYTNEGKLIYVSKQPARNYKNTAFETMEELQCKLVTYITEEVYRLKHKSPEKKLSSIGISMGAALNAHNGYIFNSGPLWGPHCLPFNLREKIEKNIPAMDISIVNDVTAGLLREVTYLKKQYFTKVMLITISTGIACRIFDMQKTTIPVDKVYGIQGEIGHIPIRFNLKNQDIQLNCDCGEKNHLNAFCSGRGMENILELVGMSFKELLHEVRKDDENAMSILDAFTKPIANFLITSFTIDPEIEKVILTGGVTHAFGNDYLKSLLRQLNGMGLYQITNHDPKIFEKRLSLGNNDDRSGLIGAALSLEYKL